VHRLLNLQRLAIAKKPHGHRRIPKSWSEFLPAVFLIFQYRDLNVQSTIGAGDTFIAGMLYSYLVHEHDWPLEQKLGFANELAGRKVVQEGFAGLAGLMQHSVP
jgi:sugar/nucleoside kinase (ribokinase family)